MTGRAPLGPPTQRGPVAAEDAEPTASVRVARLRPRPHRARLSESLWGAGARPLGFRTRVLSPCCPVRPKRHPARQRDQGIQVGRASTLGFVSNTAAGAGAGGCQRRVRSRPRPARAAGSLLPEETCVGAAGLRPPGNGPRAKAMAESGAELLPAVAGRACRRRDHSSR